MDRETDGPLAAFALDLRELKDSAERDSFGARPDPLGVGRSTVYAALAGKRLPSRASLRAMVNAWGPRSDPRDAAAYQRHLELRETWFKRRDQCEAELFAENRERPHASARRSVIPPPTREMEAFASRLRALFPDWGMLPEHLASSVQISATTLSAVLNGRRVPTLRTLYSITDSISDAVGMEQEEQEELKRLWRQAHQSRLRQRYGARP